MNRLPKYIDLSILFVINLFFFGYSWYIALVLSVVFFLGFYAFRSYDMEIMKSLNDSTIRIVAGVIFGSIILLILYPLFLENYINRNAFIYNFLISIVVFPIIHKIEYKLFEKRAKQRKYLVIGKKDEIGNILDEIQEKTLNKLYFVDYINPSPVKLDELINKEITEKKANKNNKTPAYDAILVTDPKLEEKVKDKLEEYKKMGIKIEYLPILVEKHLKRIPLKVVEKFKEHYSIIFNQEHESPAKRVVDVIVSLIALVIFSPFMLIIALGILIEDGRPVVFKQDRIGKDGKIFTMYKFRSMKNVEREKPLFADQEQDRITKVGKVIRKLRLDELPQFFNVLKGDMSVVGPRPEQKNFVEEFEKHITGYKYRHITKPGITGWAQIMYKYTSNIDETSKKLEYDLWYVKNDNVFINLKVIIQTLEAMVFKRGAM
ncbi:sugar transferase [Thermosipho melanesiensis BI429]|uniref:Sugar transferase n=2 Tax=Thermosipho melanesiensis TaxID=46541 RepID=A6LLX2_THEM4|nr:sugar transferase [Thermosipho melanesiensis]ABR30923.1 sugar transferase [Thermosipho melanesiensis BI429]APT74040.1 polyprenyl glycosylphosphotransferase [Thermosipho melanesiensis]